MMKINVQNMIHAVHTSTRGLTEQRSLDPNQQHISYIYVCDEPRDGKGGLEGLREEVMRFLTCSNFKQEYVRVAAPETKIVSVVSGDKARVAFQIHIPFVRCTAEEAHHFFAAEQSIVPAPDMKTLVSLMSLDHGALLDRTRQAARFYDMTHGYVTFYPAFESEFLADDGSLKRLRITFASATASVDASTHWWKRDSSMRKSA